jgi:hypothetical protein
MQKRLLECDKKGPWKRELHPTFVAKLGSKGFISLHLMLDRRAVLL